MSWSVLRLAGVSALCALGCGPSLPPVRVPPPDEPVLQRLSSSLSEPCGTWVERDEWPYLRSSYASLLAEPERPGALVTRAFVSEDFKCGPCPPGANCQPCRPFVVMRPYQGAADDTAFWAVKGSDEGPADGHCYEIYLRLRPGYRHHRGASADSFPDTPSRAFFGRAEPLEASRCSPAKFDAERGASAAPCLAALVPGRIVQRQGDVALPTSAMLDVVELLRRADGLFAQRRWDDARRRYTRVEEVEMVMEVQMSSPTETEWTESLPPNEPLVRCYALWRRAQCNLQLAEPQHALNDLWKILVDRAEWSCASLPGLQAAAAAELGKAFAVRFSSADEAAPLMTKMPPDIRSKALETLTELWTKSGRANEAIELRAAFE